MAVLYMLHIEKFQATIDSNRRQQLAAFGKWVKCEYDHGNGLNCDFTFNFSHPSGFYRGQKSKLGDCKLAKFLYTRKHGWCSKAKVEEALKRTWKSWLES